MHKIGITIQSLVYQVRRQLDAVQDILLGELMDRLLDQGLHIELLLIDQFVQPIPLVEVLELTEAGLCGIQVWSIGHIVDAGDSELIHLQLDCLCLVI